MNNKVLYTSDMHGNEAQFRAFVEHALQIKPSVIIIGGELFPKGGMRMTPDYPQMQRMFAKERLPELLKPIKQNLPDTPVYLMPGNDDCSVNDDLLGMHPELFTNIDGHRMIMPNGLEIVGCSLVPFTPFAIKDREVFDENETYKGREDYLRGAISVKRGDKLEWSQVEITKAHRGRALSNVLETAPFATNYAKTIYVFHTPSSNTALDIIDNGKHVGSLAVRKFIETHQPYLTLHGHIHETVDMSGSYKEQIGRSWGMSAGNHNEDRKLSVLVMDLDNIASAERVKLPCTKLGKMFGKIF